MSPVRSAALLAALAGISPCIAVAGDELRRVEAEFPEAMRRREEPGSPVRGTCRLTQTDRLGTRVFRIDFAIQGKLRKVSAFPDRSADPELPSEYVECLGLRSYFELKRKSEDRPYVLTDFGSSNGQEAKQGLQYFLDHYWLASCAIYSIPMSRLLASPGFRFTTAESVSEAGREWMKIGFRLDTSNYIRSGTIWCDPNDSWAIQRVDCRTEASDRVKQSLLCDVQYGPQREGASSIPRLVTYTVPGGPQRGPIRLRYEVIEIIPAPTPERAFSLPSYGLADLERPADDPSPRSSAPWLFGLGGTALVGAIGLKRWAARLGGI